MKEIVEGIASFEFKDGIFFGKYFEGVNLDLETSKTMVAYRLKITNNKSVPCLMDVTGVKSATKEARDYFGNEGAKLITSAAIIANSELSSCMVNFLLSVNLVKTKVPTKYFTKPENALKWLEGFK